MMDPSETQIEASNDFEQEMNNELETRFHEAETSGGISHTSTSFLQMKDAQNWDSDEEDYLDDWDKKKSANEEKVNDELFYDPDMDDEDQKWVEEQRKQYAPKSFPGAKEKPLPNSDAVLNCPACFVLLCLDCQRHDVYEHQYRAMFVQNCDIDKTQQLKYPKTKQKRSKGKKKTKELIIDGGDDDLFHPVKCNRCNTQVAVYDKDEVYHFFNVIASY